MAILAITDVGYKAVLRARRQGIHLKVTEFAVTQYASDYVPDGDSTALLGTVLYRGEIERVHATERGDRIYRLFVPDTSELGFIYEIGLYLDTGELFAVGVCDPRYDKTYRYQLRIYAFLRVPVTNNRVEFEGIISPTVPTVPDYCDLPPANLCGNNLWVVKRGHCGGASNDKVVSRYTPSLACKYANGDEWGLVSGSIVHSGTIRSFDADEGKWLTLPNMDLDKLDVAMLTVVKGPGRYLTRHVVWDNAAQRLVIADDPLLEDLIPGESEVRIWAGPGCCAGIYL
jgi:hypothetical protein